MAQQKQEQDLNQLLKVRRDKLADLQANGKDPFQITKFNQTHHSMEVKSLYEAHEAELLKDRAEVDVTEDSIQQNPVFSNINLSDIQTRIRNNKLLIVFLLSAYIVRERCALCLCMINLYAHLSHLSLIRFSGSPELCIS